MSEFLEEPDIVSEALKMNISTEDLCPEFSEIDKTIVSIFRYWISGIVLCAVGVFGFILNITAIFMLLSRANNKVFFNKLLISLFTFDSIYILMEVIDRMGFRFGLSTQIHILMYPYFLRPITKVSLTSSIFMTIAIAYERYVAIKRPIIHRQSLTSRRFRRRNLMKYIFCVLAWAIILNVPIWFESEIHWKHNPPNNTRNLTEG